MDIQLPLIADHISIGVLELSVKACVVLLATVFIIAQHGMAAAAVRHRIWVGCLVCLALLPVLGWFAPLWPIAVPVAVSQGDGGTGNVSSIPSLLLFIYLTVAIVRGSVLCRQIIRIAWLTSHAQNAGVEWSELLNTRCSRYRVTVKLCRETSSPLSWGAIHPVILLPEAALAWPERDKDMVVQHEVAHIERGDWLAQLLAQWVSVLYWPIPGIRSILEHLSLAAEQACDDRVLAGGAAPADYAALLVKLSRQNVLPASVALARPSELGLRVRTLLSSAFDHSVYNPRQGLLYAACATLVLPLASLHLVPATPSWNVVPIARAPVSVSLPTADNSSMASSDWYRPDPPAPVVKPPERPESNLDDVDHYPGSKPTIPPP